jgi:hypothetical protein
MDSEIPTTPRFRVYDTIRLDIILREIVGNQIIYGRDFIL